MTNKFQNSNFSSFNNFQPDGFEFVFLNFDYCLCFGSCNLLIINKIND